MVPVPGNGIEVKVELGGIQDLVALTVGLELVRRLERSAAAEPGARLLARAAPETVEAAAPYAARLAERIGARFELVADLALGRGEVDVSAR